MTKCETVLCELKELLEKKFPKVLIGENKRHNDGILLEGIKNIVFDCSSSAMPYMRLNMKTAENTEKDRILRVLKYRVDIEIMVKNDSDTWLKVERYKEALETFFTSLNYFTMQWYCCDVLGSIENRVWLQIGIL